jgi:hypothetical protein
MKQSEPNHGLATHEKPAQRTALTENAEPGLTNPGDLRDTHRPAATDYVKFDRFAPYEGGDLSKIKSPWGPPCSFRFAFETPK